MRDVGRCVETILYEGENKCVSKFFENPKEGSHVWVDGNEIEASRGNRRDFFVVHTERVANVVTESSWRRLLKCFDVLHTLDWVPGRFFLDTDYDGYHFIRPGDVACPPRCLRRLRDYGLGA